MKVAIKIYLLFKSAFNGRFSWFDIQLAKALTLDYIAWFHVPGWMQIIANAQQEVELPEAFVEWANAIDERVMDLFEGMHHDSDPS
jgi:hypothetical protein